MLETVESIPPLPCTSQALRNCTDPEGHGGAGTNLGNLAKTAYGLHCVFSVPLPVTPPSGIPHSPGGRALSPSHPEAVASQT